MSGLNAKACLSAATAAVALLVGGAAAQTPAPQSKFLQSADLDPALILPRPPKDDAAATLEGLCGTDRPGHHIG